LRHLLAANHEVDRRGVAEQAVGAGLRLRQHQGRAEVTLGAQILNLSLSTTQSPLHK